MIYLIKFIFFLLFSHKAIALEINTNEILFKINNKVYTNVDFEKRKEYVALINNFIPSEFSKTDNKEIIDDYISSLIFYEYYTQNNIVYKNLNEEINLTYEKKYEINDKFNKEDIKNLKFNSKIDLIRNKIIEEFLNSQINNLLHKVNKLDLLYNYNLQYIIINEELIDNELIKDIDDRNKFNDLKKFLKDNKIDFFYKEKDINDNNIISNKIKNIINQDIPIYIDKNNGYINLISINKNLESYDGIFVKLINFNTQKPLEKKDLQCNKLNQTIDINKTIFREYEYSKLNDRIKNNLKSINDYIFFKDSGNYNYIVLCDLTYDQTLLENINFNKKVNSLVEKIQNNFLKIYKDEYKFIKVK
tara:strand:- start:16 stop:1098 length:1083 start_codon:yes stop_codon:yes gene_type:complete